jgi:hypothetical protein
MISNFQFLPLSSDIKKDLYRLTDVNWVSQQMGDEFLTFSRVDSCLV